MSSIIKQYYQQQFMKLKRVTNEMKKNNEKLVKESKILRIENGKLKNLNSILNKELSESRQLNINSDDCKKRINKVNLLNISQYKKIKILQTTNKEMSMVIKQKDETITKLKEKISVLEQIQSQTTKKKNKIIETLEKKLMIIERNVNENVGLKEAECDGLNEDWLRSIILEEKEEMREAYNITESSPESVEESDPGSLNNFISDDDMGDENETYEPYNE